MLLARNVGKKFGARLVLRGVNFEIERGTVAAVVGRNGAGKSTLLRLVSGLMRLSSGEICWRDSDSAPLQSSFEPEMRARCGLAAPDAPLPRELTVGENLEFWSQLRLASNLANREALLLHLEAWELRERWNDLAGDLSSGLRARLQLAVATLHAPPLLLLDEPGANLDESGRALLQSTLMAQRERGVALIATNDPREAALCDTRIEL